MVQTGDMVYSGRLRGKGGPAHAVESKGRLSPKPEESLPNFERSATPAEK